MVFTQGLGFVAGALFGLPYRSLRCHVLVCNAVDTASLATRFLFDKLFGVATLFELGEKRCRKNLPLSGRSLPMNQRDRAAKLAKTDFSAALKLARDISEVRERIQSLGWVARYAPAAEVSRVVAMAAKSAGTSSDFYADMMALAWPLRALYETGNGASIPPLLKTALSLSEDVQPASSRAEALGLLIHAVLPTGLCTTRPAIAKLKSVASDSHWRVVRSLIDTALLVNSFDRQSALNIAHAIPLENKRNSAVKRLSDGETMEPRPFFW